MNLAKKLMSSVKILAICTVLTAIKTVNSNDTILCGGGADIAYRDNDSDCLFGDAGNNIIKNRGSIDIIISNRNFSYCC
ncbi:MAG: hypothetical protein VKN72_20480 [Nostocales cyanobacterium 94392]|nr:hypothetical protein [Nostocales cyanobacterium 94392]